MKMAALEAALEKTINELSQDGGILENVSRADGSAGSADASENDINAQIDKWLYLHENDTQLQLIDDSFSESDSGTAHSDSIDETATPILQPPDRISCHRTPVRLHHKPPDKNAESHCAPHRYALSECDQM